MATAATTTAATTTTATTTTGATTPDDEFKDDFAADFRERAEDDELGDGADGRPGAAGAAGDSDAGSETEDVRVPDDARETEMLEAAAARPGELRSDPAYRRVMALAAGTEPAASAHEDQAAIVECNALLSRMEMAVEALHRRACRAYAAVFPELESLVPDALDYARVVLRYGESDEADLASILPSAQVMVVKVSKTNCKTSVRGADPAPVREAMDACREVAAVEADRASLLGFVERRMQRYAPNLSNLVGARCASLLVGAAGGLDKLACIPSNNVQVMGRRKAARVAGVVVAGAGSRGLTRHAGLLAEEAPVVARCPPQFRRRALRVAAGKAVMCARIDGARSDREGRSGARWREELERKIEAWRAPGPGKVKKPLPVPDAVKPKKRGGRRARREREILGLTQMHAMANRMSVSATSNVEYSVAAMSDGLGMLGEAAATGRVRAVQARDTQKLGERAAKKLRGIHAAGGRGAGPALSGFASIAFTPVQGMELGAKTSIASLSASAAGRSLAPPPGGKPSSSS